MNKLLLAALLSLPLSVSAATATLNWTPPTDKTGIAGYQVRYGTAAGARTTVVDVPGATTATATVPNLVNGTTYYFAVRSRNATTTAFSADSNEVSAMAALSAPSGVTITITVTTE
jgi:hypothetical protein